MFWLASSREATPPNSVQQKVAKHWTTKHPPKQSPKVEKQKQKRPKIRPFNHGGHIVPCLDFQASPQIEEYP